jgi:hypothetical protein
MKNGAICSFVWVITPHWMPWKTESPSHPKQIHLEVMSEFVKPPYLPITSKVTPLMLFEIAPISTFSRVNKTGTHFQFYITYPWILIHYCTSIVVTSSTLTTTKLAVEIINNILERTTSCMASTICQPLLSYQCYSGVFFTFNNKNNSFNNSYSNIGIPCKRICKTIANRMNFFRAAKWIPDYTKVMTNSEFHTK